EAAHLIVLLTLLCVAQYLVRLRDFLEALRGLRLTLVRVRVMLFRETTILLLDLVGRRLLGHAENIVEILLSHGRGLTFAPTGGNSFPLLHHYSRGTQQQ